MQPWFKDHSFRGQAVLPAVETMQLLANEVGQQYPEIQVQYMEEARFAKFLVLPEGTVSLEALVECTELSHGRISAKLCSRVKIKKMTRLIEHGSVVFSFQPHAIPSLKFEDFPSDQNWLKEIPAETIYSDLVPFGPAYQTIQDRLYLAPGYAYGSLKAPDFPLSDRLENRFSLGSPFPLDGALHGACVLGQQEVDFIPFPVGFARRIIHKPTCPGGQYTACIREVDSSPTELVFDLALFDSQNTFCEAVYGLQMRDVSRGL